MRMSASQPAAKESASVAGTESRGSSTPLLNDSTPIPNEAEQDQQQESQDSPPSVHGAEGISKTRKRDFWRIGKKQDEEKQKSKANSSTSTRPSTSGVSGLVGLRPASPLRPADATIGISASPHRSNPYGIPSSPGRGRHSASPRPQSPASSMIFERNVQEDVSLPEVSPHLPSHVLTENYIPPALDASAEAITNDKLDPDEVEIVTHATHQPAAVTITGVGADHSLSSSVHDEFSHAHRQDTDNTSTYGSLDSTDVRRLSFISFADVVHAEQELGDQRRDSTYLSGPPALAGGPRSPSPVRSPVSSQALSTSPPTSIAASVKGLETSPNRGVRGAGSPLPGQSSPLGELNIETMRQALRKTGSGDLSHFRSAPGSAVGNDDGVYERPFR